MTLMGRNYLGPSVADVKWDDVARQTEGLLFTLGQWFDPNFDLTDCVASAGRAEMQIALSRVEYNQRSIEAACPLFHRFGVITLKNSSSASCYSSSRRHS